MTKREDFQRMINECMNGEIDMVITKSISRFARNTLDTLDTLDTLKYVRMLKEKNIAVYFEYEKINMVIGKELENLGYKTRYGSSSWAQSTVI